MAIKENVIGAYSCGETYLPNDRCKHCPYGYGYLDESGDNAFWTCDTEKLMRDAILVILDAEGTMPEVLYPDCDLISEKQEYIRCADCYRFGICLAAWRKEHKV